MKTNQSFEYSAKFYDLIYKEKNYEKETAFIEDIFKTFTKPKSILEIGCGTGNYTQILHRKGYEMTGLDISENMINVARMKKLSKICLNVNTDNDRAINLYKKAGFEIEGKLCKESYVNGEYRDEYRMALFL